MRLIRHLDKSRIENYLAPFAIVFCWRHSETHPIGHPDNPYSTPQSDGPVSIPLEELLEGIYWLLNTL